MTRDPGAALLRALLRGAPRLELVEMASRDWASATFTGARHAIRFEAADEEALWTWLEALAACDLTVRGQTVVDVATSEVTRREGRVAVTIAVLTVDA